jgi:hypothetical protein
MKTLKETVIVCLFMLMVSMNVMAQRETLTFIGIMANFPHGGSAETVLTIKPDGKYVFDVKKSKTVEPFTISGQMPVPMLLKLSLKVPQSDTLSYPVTLECTLKR